MAKQLAVHTHAMDEQGRPVHFAPGDTVPAWARAQLTNPKLWGTPQAEAAPAVGEAPTRSGKGSGLEAWRAYAEGHGVGLDEGMSRDDIIAACEQAGVVDREE